MSALETIWISDASPLFKYSPDPIIADTALTAPWSIQPSDSNDTRHVTSGPAGLILPSIYSSSFEPVWSGSTDGYSLHLVVNDSPPQSINPGLAAQFDAGINTLMLAVRCGGSCSPINFSGANLGVKMVPDGVTGQSIQIDDADKAITYTGFAPISSPGSITVTADDYDQTLSSTGSEGATASVSFKGVYGVTGPSLGVFSVTIDGNDQGTYSAANSIDAHGVLLFFAGNLDASQHTLELEAKSGAKIGLVIDSFVAWGPQGVVGFSPSRTDLPDGSSDGVPGDAAQGSGTPNGGVIAGAILGSLAGLLLLIWIFRRGIFSIKKNDKKLDPWDEANMLQKQKNEAVHVTTVAKQRYVYRKQVQGC
ncbi:hypothetical protein BD324DRAFT_651912 [Kockovaella imperatae]|uniref:Uncharacterized protein n=1 Tax=Kockovaella imperatae TaxID=4999 RepID=A0A1Y1UG10_9TREE|nr:hypothetical protein BD324DRAFT_651912 [Kockovaella imperatae]ORX36005.1 hypothetical protein BD324DRAFT_651912 [Kockovaella imperatae]